MPSHIDLGWPGQVYTYEGQGLLNWEKPMTRVKFVYREQVVQVITGNDRKGEVTVITRDKDVPAHEVEKTVRKLADTRTD